MLPNRRTAPDKKKLRSVRLIGLCASLFLIMWFAFEPASTSTTSTTNQAQKLLAEADALRASWTQADLRKALQKYDSATVILTPIPDLPSASLAALQAGDVCFHLSEFSEALKRYETSETLAEKGGDRLVQGRALSKLGRVYVYQGKNDLAQAELTKAVALLETNIHVADLATRSAYGEALINVAEITYSKGNFAKVLDQLNLARGFLHHDEELQARIHLMTANTVGGLGDAERGLAEADRALELYKRVNNRVGEGLALVARGLSCSFKGQAEKAIPLNRDAIKIFQSSGDRHSEARATSALGQAYERLSKLALARSHYERGLRLYESLSDSYSVAVMSFKQATMYLDENPEKARNYYDRCLTLSRAQGLLRNEANALSEIALVYASQKRPDLAAQQFRKAQELFEQIGDRRGKATAMNRYGEYLFKLGLKQPALDVYNEALPLSQNVGDTSILLDTLFNLASANQALGNHAAALSFIEQSITWIEKLRAGVGIPDLRTLYFSGVRRHYDLCIEILMQLDQKRPGEHFNERAFLMSEKSRARSLVDLVRETQSKWREDEVDSYLLRHERQVAALIRSLSEYKLNLSLSRQRDPAEEFEVDNEITQLSAQYHEIQVDLRAQAKNEPALAEFELKDIEQVQRELRSGDSMLLEYSLGSERSYLWAITSDSFQSYELPQGKVLEEAARELYELLTARQKPDANQATIEAADRQYSEKAVGLSQMLLGPVAAQLGNKKLVVVREGVLQLIPFDALFLPGSQEAGPGENQYLGATNEIVALPSMSTLLAARATKRRPASSDQVIAILADPVFSQTDDRVQAGSSTVTQPASFSEQQGSVSGVNVSRLIHSSAEADEIAARAPYGSTMVSKGFEASRETAMSQRVGESQIIHFATHGFLDTEFPELSAIVLTSVRPNGGKQDGVMPLNDIYSLKLSAELTVLSACQTALGTDIRGEGLIGLTHGFMSAGSKSVVASLWKVEDEATAMLMSYFYEAMLQQGLPASAALRAAKLRMMEDKRWSAPYYWAGFVFQGDYESRVNVKGNSRLAFGLGLLMLVLVSSALIVFLRRRRRTSPAKRN